jgi:hypothetical protein
MNTGERPLLNMTIRVCVKCEGHGKEGHKVIKVKGHTRTHTHARALFTLRHFVKTERTSFALCLPCILLLIFTHSTNECTYK